MTKSIPGRSAGVHAGFGPWEQRESLFSSQNANGLSRRGRQRSATLSLVLGLSGMVARGCPVGNECSAAIRQEPLLVFLGPFGIPAPKPTDAPNRCNPNPLPPKTPEKALYGVSRQGGDYSIWCTAASPISDSQNSWLFRSSGQATWPGAPLCSGSPIQSQCRRCFPSQAPPKSAGEDAGKGTSNRIGPFLDLNQSTPPGFRPGLHHEQVH